MWKLTLLVFVFMSKTTFTISDANNDTSVFNKCCPRDQSLIKITENFNSSEEYECVNDESLKKNYNITSDPLHIRKNVELNVGLPLKCNELKMTPLNKADEGLIAEENRCYDLLVAEIFNGSIKQNIPKTVELCCNSTEDKSITHSSLQLHHIRKCCSKGERYDMEFHQCRKVAMEENDDLFNWNLNLSDNSLYEIEYGLNCKFGEYAVEMIDKLYDLSINGSSLIAIKKEGKQGGMAMPGEWCIDHDYNMNRLVAQVCTKDCEKFGAYCVAKCCPPGYHFKLLRCGTFASTCVPNEDSDVLFNISKYLNPLKATSNEADWLDVMGVRVGVDCPRGRYALNESIPQDKHLLNQRGYLENPTSVTKDYCFEMFDRRDCPNDDVVVNVLLCFLPAIEVKDFRFSFITITISSVCLALTLIVYCALPELKNLHGRNLICHVSMMLLACSCLARVQYSAVKDDKACTLLGYGIYFGFVAAFAWLNVMCFDIWWTFGSVRTVKLLRKSGSEKKRFLWYSLYAWGTTILLTVTMFVLDLYPISPILDANIGNGACWFGTLQNTDLDWPHYVFFVIPMGLVTCTNFILWLLTARYCAQVKSEVHRLQAGSVGDRAKRRFRIDRAKYILTGKLWVVMGAGWISELLSTLVQRPQWLWNIVDLFNEMQGVLIFIILVIKPKLYYLIKKRLGLSRTPIDPRLEKPDAQKNTTSSSGRTSSTFLSRTISSDERTTLRASLPNTIKHS